MNKKYKHHHDNIEDTENIDNLDIVDRYASGVAVWPGGGLLGNCWMVGWRRHGRTERR